VRRDLRVKSGKFMSGKQAHLTNAEAAALEARVSYCDLLGDRKCQ
jgi:hypothetical protein